MAVDEKDPPIPPGFHAELKLETLGDMRRAMGKVANEMRSGRTDVKLGNALMFAFTQLAHVMQDQRDTKYQKRLKVLWAAHQGQQPTPEVDEAEVQ